MASETTFVTTSITTLTSDATTETSTSSFSTFTTSITSSLPFTTATNTFPVPTVTDTLVPTATATASSIQSLFNWNWNKLGIIVGAIFGIIILAALINCVFQYRKSGSSQKGTLDRSSLESNGGEPLPPSTTQQYAWFSFSRKATPETIARMIETQSNLTLSEKYLEKQQQQQQVQFNRSSVAISRPAYVSQSMQPLEQYSYDWSIPSRRFDGNTRTSSAGHYPLHNMHAYQYPSDRLSYYPRPKSISPFNTDESVSNHQNLPYPLTDPQILFSRPSIDSNPLDINIIMNNQCHTDAGLSRNMKCLVPSQEIVIDQHFQKQVIQEQPIVLPNAQEQPIGYSNVHGQPVGQVSDSQQQAHQPISQSSDSQHQAHHLIFSKKDLEESPLSQVSEYPSIINSINMTTTDDEECASISSYLKDPERDDEIQREGNTKYPLRQNRDGPVKIVDKLLTGQDESQRS